jgi:DNA-binding NtrC family response regulator
MQAVVSLAVHVAPSDAPVLVTGPNGSGKEKIAEIIQANSRRAAGPFVRVNAGDLPDELLEAELFGAEAGAFTGATKLRVGRFEAAHGGTLFLDEIGNLSLAGQAKLLRVLQTGELERLGSSRTIKTDVRIVSATNLDLKRAIAAGQFREDLYFRLNVIELAVPPLAARTADIVPLAETFLAQHAPARSFGEAAVSALLHHDWPGNVRELQNRVQRAALVASSDQIRAEDLGLGAQRGAAERKTGDLERRAAEPEGGADPERAAIEQALLDAGGVVSKAALTLGLSRQALYRRMERVGLAVERKVKL